MREWASLLIPFDIGQTHVFMSSSGGQIEDRWSQAFAGFPYWVWKHFPSTFGKPLGCPARLDIFPFRKESHSLGACAPLESLEDAAGGFQEAFSALVPWADPQRFKVTALLFPFGIGVLIVRLDLSWAARTAASRFRSDRNRIMDGLKPLIVGCGDYYIFCLMRATALLQKRNQGPDSLIKAQGVDRKERVKESAFLFPIFFAESYDYDVLVKGYPRENGGAGACHSYDGAEVYVAWTEAFVKEASATTEEYIVNNFVVSLVSWYALSAMDRFAYSRSQEALATPAAGHRSMSANEIRVMRFVYMDTINASNPVQWTTREKDLLLLERIHTVWGSSRLWNIEGRAALLESHYKAFEADEVELRSGRLTRLGLFVAVVAVTSVVADVIGLASQDGAGLEAWLFRNRFQITLSVFIGMVVLGLIGLTLQMRSRRR